MQRFHVLSPVSRIGIRAANDEPHRAVPAAGPGHAPLCAARALDPRRTERRVPLEELFLPVEMAAD